MKSVFSHLASADRPDQDDATRRQVEAFDRAAALRTVCPRIKTHLLNSSGLMRFPNAAGDYVRVGIALLGVVPASDMDLKPVVHFETAIASLHRIPPNEGVGYGLEDAANYERILATLPVGYADGYPRSLSNGRGHVVVRGERVPVVGKVCMDMTMVDVTSVPGARVGTAWNCSAANCPSRMSQRRPERLPMKFCRASPRGCFGNSAAADFRPSPSGSTCTASA